MTEFEQEIHDFCQQPRDFLIHPAPLERTPCEVEIRQHQPIVLGRELRQGWLGFKLAKGEWVLDQYHVAIQAAGGAGVTESLLNLPTAKAGWF